MTTKLNARIEVITPKLAEQYLEKNGHNRKLSKSRVRTLVGAMNRGEWVYNADPIRFAITGRLIDGQTRLAAVMVSKKPIESLVIRGLPESVMSTIDIGKIRTNGDHLKMAGYEGAVFALAAAVGVCLSFNSKGEYSNLKMKSSPDEILEYTKNNKRILKSLEIYSSNREFAELLPQSVSIACHFLFCEIDKDKGESFFHHLVKGANLGVTSPILKLRTELIAMRKETKRGYTSRHAFLHFMTTAFSAYLNDKRTDRLPEYRREGKVMLPKV